MDSPTAIRSPATTDHGRCVKFFCSFLGSILPRPQDGKLRYVGGETRIVSVSRDISYDELIGKMKEVYEGVAVLKYKHSDEGLDALVSVVNDDDVVNMMDKLGSGDEFTGLMIFLFSQSDQDGSHSIDGDDFERRYVDALNSLNDDSERRYVDALNSLNDASDFRRLQQMEFLMIEDIHVGDQFFNPRTSMENGIHSQRIGDLSMSEYDLHHIRIPHQQPMGQRYNEMDAPWSPAYYSPRHHGHHDSRALAEFPSSPSGTRYRMPFPESGFPGNFLHGHHALDGNSICEQCRISFQRAEPHLEHPNIPSPIANQCAECSSNKDTFTVNYDAKLRPAMYPNEPSNDHRSVYNQAQNPGREWGLQRQTSVPVEESRRHFSGSGRMTDHYVSDVPILNFPHGHCSASDGNTLPSNYVHQLAGPELGAELFPDQTMAAIPHLRIPPLEESSLRYGNAPSPYGVDNNYDVAHGHTPGSAFRINAPTPVRNGLSHEATTTLLQLVDGMIMSGSIGREISPGFSNGPDSQAVHNGPPYEATTTALQLVDGMIMSGSIRREGSPGFSLGLDSQSPLVVSSQKFPGHDGSAIPEHPYADALKLNPNALVDGIHPPQDIVAGTDVYISKIEPTKAEAEAIARGLQTIKNDDLEEIRELGSGAYGTVFHGKWKGSDVAIKRIKASCFTGRPSERARLIADFWKEALILSSLHHPNVVFFYGVVRDGPDGSLATVTELMDGSLKQFLHKNDRTIDRRKRLSIAMDAAFGMEYLHGKNIVHFDLKCDNLLVNMRDPQRPVCKIGDLGLSKVKQLTLVSGGVRGTLPWMAPELLTGKSNMVSEKIDVYSFGIVMWELLTGDEPYADMHYASIIGGIVNSTLRPQIPTWCDTKWKSLMESCWASDPIERPSFSEISKKLRTLISLC